ncbi:glycosyltransferase [Geodermatophilus sp. SYSU D00766]
MRRAPFAAYDFDDALQWDTSGGVLRSRLFSKARTCRMAVGAADVVMAGSDVLGNWAAEHSRNVVVIPSCVEPLDYKQKSTYEVSESPRILWVGSPSTERQLRSISRPLLETCEAFGARVRVVSSGFGDLGELSTVVDRVDWSPAVTKIELANADVGVAPLINNPFERGKCAYKLLQYGAAGLPIVGSPVGANQMALERLQGYAAETEAEWVAALASSLEASVRERERIGREAIAGVQRYYSYTSWADAWKLAVGVTP